MSLKKSETLKFIRKVLKAYDAKIANQYVTPAEIASYNSGGSGAVNVFTGASASTAGTSGIVPPPAAGDNEKFLCGNGTWAAIEGGGANYPIASASNAGLMSAEDKQHLDALFLDTADLTDAVITVVGGNFCPSVNTLEDFNANKNNNLPYFENRLKNIFLGSGGLNNDFVESGSVVTMQGGDAVLRYNPVNNAYNYTHFFLSEGVNSVICGTDGATVTVFYPEIGHEINKISESIAYIRRETQVSKNSSWSYFWNGPMCIQVLRVDADSKVASVQAASICSATSSVQSAAAGSEFIADVPTFFNPVQHFFITDISAMNASGGYTNYYYSVLEFNAATGTIYTKVGITLIGKLYAYGTTSTTEISSVPTTNCKKALFSFANNSCTISFVTWNKWPFLKFSTIISDASGNYNNGASYVWLFFGNGNGTPSVLQTETVSSGVSSTINDWLEDNNNFIAGFWRSRSSSKIYAITFKKGTYDTTREQWFDNAATVWLFDWYKPRCIKTSIKLSDILHDLII